MVKHSHHHFKVEGSSLAATDYAGRERKEWNAFLLYMITIIHQLSMYTSPNLKTFQRLRSILKTPCLTLE
jgi:hypothetical protein